MSKNAVEIVISAVDGASNVLTGISTGLLRVSQVINNQVQSAFLNLSTAAFNSFRAVAGAVTDIIAAINTVDSALRNFANTSLAEVVQARVNDLVEEISDTSQYNFSDSLAVVGTLAGNAFVNNLGTRLSSVVGVINTRLNNVPSTLLNIFDKAFFSAQKAVLAYKESLQSVLSGIEFLAPITGIEEAQQLFGALKGSALQFAGSINNIVGEISLITGALGSLQSIVATGPYQLLISQNVQLQEQLLATKSSLVATNKIIQAGTNIIDPTQAIKALDVPVQAAIDKIRQGSLELVGVTSNQLIDSFQIIAGQIGNIGGSLDDATKLTLSFAASLGTMGLDLSQARQEITSILTGTIDMNSVLAKSLNLTNSQVASWKSQGKLIDELTKRLEPFRAGNALAAKTINGVTSNIQEYIEEIARIAGSGLLDPIVDELNKVYDFLKVNKDELAAISTNIAKNLGVALQALADGLGKVFGASQNLIGNTLVLLFDALTTAIKTLGEALANAAVIFAPFLDILGRLASLGQLLNPLFQVYIQVKLLTTGMAALTGAFGMFANAVPGVGELLFVMGIRSNSLIGLFTGLSGAVGQGAASFLTFGASLNKIPFLFNIIASKIPIFGTALAGLIPSLASGGIALIGLSQKFPFIASMLSSINAQLPVLVTRLASFASAQGFTGLATQLNSLSTQTDLVKLANEKFAVVLAEVRSQAIKAAVSFALVTAGIIAAVFIVKEFILENEALKETLGQVFEGLKGIATVIGSVLTNPIIGATLVITALSIAIRSGLVVSILQLISTQLAAWALNISTAFGSLAGVLRSIQFTGMASGALSTSDGFAKLSIAIQSLQWGELFTQIRNGTILLKLKGLAAGIASIGLKGLAFVLNSVGLSSAAAAVSSQATALSVTASGAAAGVASTGFAALASSIWATVAGLTTLLAPILAVAAAIGAIGLFAYSQMLGESTEATEEYRKQSDALADSSIQVASKISAAKKRQKEADEKGIKLSDEEYKQNKQLLAQGKEKVAQLDDQIATLQAAKKEAVGDENKNALEAQIKTLEKMKSSLNALSTDVKIAPKDLPRVGSELEQLADKAKSARDAITKSNGDPEIYKKKAEELIQITERQLQIGQIGEAEARQNLGLITSNANVTNDIIQKAQETLTKVIESESKKRTEAITSQRALLESRIASGQVTELEGEQKLTASKKEELNIQLKNIEDNLAAEKKARQKAYEETVANLDKQLTEETKKFNEAKTPEEKATSTKSLTSLNEKRTQAEADLQAVNKELDRKFGNEKLNNQAQREKLEVDNLKNTQNIKIKRLEEASKKAIDITTTAETARNLATVKLYNNDVISQVQADERRVNSSRTRIKEELAAEQNRLKQLESLPLPKNESDKAAREEQIRASRLKTQQLVQSSLEGERKAYDAHINTIVDNIKGDQTQAQIDLNKLVNTGAKSEQDLALLTATQKVSLLNKQIALETKNKDKRQQLELELQAALRDLYNKGIENQLAAFDRTDKARQIALQKLINNGAAIEAQAASQNATAERERIEKQLELETKNKDKRLQLELDYQKAIKAERDAQKQEVLTNLDLEFTQERTSLQNRLNLGQVSERRAAVVRAEQKLQSLQEELRLEENNQEKRIKLEEQVAEAIGALQEARIEEIKAKQETANQIYLNQIEKQNQALQRQQNLYDLLDQALQQRNKLLEASRDLAKATADFITGELDLISQGEKSEYRKRQLAEITAAIKLEALRKQQEFERESLKMAQEQNRLALEREKIQNRIKQGEALANIAQTKADVALLQADPKKANSESGRAQLEALQLKLGAQEFSFTQLQQESAFLDRKGAINQQVEAADIRKLQMKQTLEQDQARFALAQALPPGVRERATRGLQDEFAKKIGAESREDLFTSGQSFSRGVAQREFGNGVGAPGLSAYDPELEYLSGVLSPEQMQAATNSVARSVTQKFGSIDGSVLQGMAPGGKQLQLLPGFSGLGQIPKIDLAPETLSKLGNTLNLAPVNNINIQVTGGTQEVAKTTGDSVLKQLDSVFKQAEAIAKSRFGGQ